MSKCNWIQTRHRLIMELSLDMTVYNNSNMELPPSQLGKCTEWRFELSPETRQTNLESRSMVESCSDISKPPLSGIQITEVRTFTYMYI